MILDNAAENFKIDTKGWTYFYTFYRIFEVINN